MDEYRLLMAMPPFWRKVVIDGTLIVAWAVCVGICDALMSAGTDHPPLVCLLASLAPGSLLFWGAIAVVQAWCAAAGKIKK